MHSHDQGKRALLHPAWRLDPRFAENPLVAAEPFWSSTKVLGALADVVVWKGVPKHIRSGQRTGIGEGVIALVWDS